MRARSSWLALVLMVACGEPEAPPPAVIPPTVASTTQESGVAAACGGDTRCLAAQRLTNPTLRSALKIRRYDGGPLCADAAQEERCQTDARRAIAQLFDTRCGNYVPNDRPPLPTGTVFEKQSVMYDTTGWVGQGGTAGDLDGDSRDEYIDMSDPEIRVVTGGATMSHPGASAPEMGARSRVWITYAPAPGGKLRRADFGADLRALSYVQSGGKRKLIGVMDDWRAVSFDVEKVGNAFVATNRKALAKRGTTARGLRPRKTQFTSYVEFQVGSDVNHKPMDRVESTVLDGRPVLVTMASEWLADLDGRPLRPGTSVDDWHLHPNVGVAAFFVATMDFTTEEITWRKIPVKALSSGREHGRKIDRLTAIETFTLENRFMLANNAVRSDPEPYVNLVVKYNGEHEWRQGSWASTSGRAAWARCKLNLTECEVESYAHEGYFFEDQESAAQPGTLRMSVLSDFDYRIAAHREPKSNHNILFVYSSKQRELVWGPSLAFDTRGRRSLPLGPRINNNVLGWPTRRVRDASPPYAGDYYGRRVLVEKLMLEGRHVVFPTAILPKLEMLLLPPPHWFAMQDFPQATLDFTRGRSGVKDSTYGSQVANGTSWQLGGGLRAPIGNINYSHDEEETKFTHTTTSTSFTTTRSIFRAAPVEIEPQALVQFLCSDDFWYRVKRGNLPRLDEAGRPRRDTSLVLVRDPLEGGEQFMMVQVPRRTGEFFKNAGTARGFAAQAAVDGEVSPILREPMPLWEYNHLMLTLGQEWRQIDLKRLIGYPPSYFEDRTTNDSQAKTYYDINGRRKADVVVLGTHAVPAVGSPTVSWSVDDAVDRNAMRQVMRGTTWSSSDRIHADLSLPFAELGSPSISGSYGWTASRSNEVGDGEGTGTHESTRYSFSWNGWKIQALLQDYFDARLANEGVSAIEQRRALKEAGGYSWNDTVGVRTRGDGDNPGAIVDVPFVENFGDAQREHDAVFRNLLLERINFTSTVYTYRHSHEKSWTVKDGPFKDQRRSGKMEFVVLDYAVKWHKSNPPALRDYPHFFPIRKRAAFRVKDRFCDFFRNQVVEVQALGDDGRPLFGAPREGRCYRQFDGPTAFMCREDRERATAECVRRVAAKSVVRPKSVRSGLSLRSGFGERLCTGGFVYQWSEEEQDYEIQEVCEAGCEPNGMQCATLPPMEEPVDPETVQPVPGCAAAQETACYWDDGCCSGWSEWCEIVAGGACSVVDDPVLFACGDGIVDDHGAEACDDGNQVNGDGCSADCQVLEEAGPDDACGEGCLLDPVCGDGLLGGTEECDDGNEANGDDCSAGCQIEAGCGNGWLDEQESCDDGNAVNGDGCDATCDIEWVEWMEGAHEPVCGDGTEVGDALCPVAVATCGNGVVEGAEQCDDGDADETDACNSACIARSLFVLDVRGAGVVRVSQGGQTVCTGGCSEYVAPAGDLTLHAESVGGVVPSVAFPSAVCDYGQEGAIWSVDCVIPVDALAANSLINDGSGELLLRAGPPQAAVTSLTFVRAAECGDGVKSPLEECDDGNTENGDGCNDVCQEVPCPPGQRVVSQMKRDGVDDLGCRVGVGSRSGGVWVLTIFGLGLATCRRLRRLRREGAGD